MARCPFAARDLWAATGLGVAALAVLVAGCGARTGLQAPGGGKDTGPAEPPPGGPEPPGDAGRSQDADAGDGLEPGRGRLPRGARDGGPAPRCIEITPGGEPVRATFTRPVSLAVVDVMFLLDATESMVDEIDTIRSRLRSRVVPGVRDAIADAQFGVAFLGEFPEQPHGPSDVRPYTLQAPITSDVLQVEAALDSAPTWGNKDEPEAQIEALYQVMTGEGLEPWIPRQGGCPGGGSGGACFRRDALPVVLLATDAPFHNGPPGVSPHAPYRFRPEPHGYEETVEEIERRNAVVLGLGATHR